MAEIKDIPKDWKWTSIPDVIGKNGVFVDGDWIESKDQDPKGDVRLIQLADIGDGNFRNKSSRFLTLKRAKEINCTFLSEGDILVARMPDPIGRACIFPLKGENKYVTAVDVAIIRPEDKIIDKKYLLYSINNPKFRNNIEDLQSGTTRKRISRKNLSILEFPLPPKPTQQAIVSKIEELFSELDKGIENLGLAQQQLKTYRQSVLKWAFEGKLTNENIKDSELPKGWKMEKMGEVIEKPKYGTSKKCEYETKGIGVLRIPNIVKGIVDSDDLKFAKFDKQEIDTYSLKEGDILTIRSNGSVDIVGKCALITKKDEGFLYAGYLIRLRPLQKLVLSKYLTNSLLSISLRNQIEEKAKSTSGVNNINSEELAGLVISLPPIEEQHRIVQEIESRLSVADKMEESITQSLQQAEALRQSILKKAFEGKLITVTD